MHDIDPSKFSDSPRNTRDRILKKGSKDNEYETLNMHRRHANLFRRDSISMAKGSIDDSVLRSRKFRALVKLQDLQARVPQIDLPCQPGQPVKLKDLEDFVSKLASSKNDTDALLRDVQNLFIPQTSTEAPEHIIRAYNKEFENKQDAYYIYNDKDIMEGIKLIRQEISNKVNDSCKDVRGSIIDLRSDIEEKCEILNLQRSTLSGIIFYESNEQIENHKDAWKKGNKNSPAIFSKEETQFYQKQLSKIENICRIGKENANRLEEELNKLQKTNETFNSICRDVILEEDMNFDFTMLHVMKDKFIVFEGALLETKTDLEKIFTEVEYEVKDVEAKLPFREEIKKQMEQKLGELYPDAIRNLPDHELQEIRKHYPDAPRNLAEVIKNLAIFRSLTPEYCHQVMEDLQTDMKQQNLSQEEILSQREREQDFGPCVEVNKLLSPNEFMSIVSQGLPMKDAGAGYRHGPYTHREQLLIVFQAFKDKIITMEPIRLYKYLADPRFRLKGRTIWDSVFDNLQKNTEGLSIAGISSETSLRKVKKRLTYSCPEFMLEHLLTNLSPGPLKKELALTYLQQHHFGNKSALNQESWVNCIKEKIRLSYQSKINKEEIDKMSSKELEELYISLGIKKPTEYDLEGDYGLAKEKILQENG